MKDVMVANVYNILGNGEGEALDTSALNAYIDTQVNMTPISQVVSDFSNTACLISLHLIP
jgi:hypothetical protein